MFVYVEELVRFFLVEWICVTNGIFTHAAPTFCVKLLLDTCIYSAGKKSASSCTYAKRQNIVWYLCSSTTIDVLLDYIPVSFETWRSLNIILNHRAVVCNFLLKLYKSNDNAWNVQCITHLRHSPAGRSLLWPAFGTDQFVHILSLSSLISIK